MSVIGIFCGVAGEVLLNSLGGDLIWAATEGLIGAGGVDPIG